MSFLDDLDAALVQSRMVMGRMFERLDPNDFLVFRRYFEGWKSASEYSREHLPNGLTLAGVEGRLGLQMGFNASDAFAC